MIKCLSVLFVSFLFLMTGCAPKVITNISKSYPASVTADKVRLYELGRLFLPRQRGSAMFL